MREIVAGLFFLSGGFFILVAAIGLVRLPDLYCRAHALTKAMTLGILLVLLGMAIQLWTESITLKVGLAIFFQFVTIPVTGHLLAFVAYEKNFPRWKKRPILEL